MTNTLTLPFGLSEAVPADVDVAWGARFIINMNGHVDLPPDRQGCAGDGDRDDLLDRMAHACPPAELFALIRDRILDGTINTTSMLDTVLVDDLGIKIVANPMGSGGYLYVAAFRTDAAMDAQAALS